MAVGRRGGQSGGRQRVDARVVVRPDPDWTSVTVVRPGGRRKPLAPAPPIALDGTQNDLMRTLVPVSTTEHDLDALDVDALGDAL